MITAELETLEEKLMEGKKLKPLIMIVDDNIELLEELENLLKLGGYDVITLSDGTKAFEMAFKNKPDLMLLDLRMSPKSGFQIADETSKSSYLKDIPVVAMTGFFTEKQHSLMMKLCGIKAVILKPFRPINLFTKIEFVLGKNHLNDFDSEVT